MYEHSLTRCLSLKSLIEHLKPVVAAKLNEGNTTTPTSQGTDIAQFPSLPSAEDGKILDVEDSMLGQPPSVCAVSPLPTRPRRDRRKKSDEDQALEDMDVELGLDMALRHMYREVQEENIEVCVLEERLDEKDIALMDGASACVFFLWLVKVFSSFSIYFLHVSPECLLTISVSYITITRQCHTFLRPPYAWGKLYGLQA
jgi:hypothetical protein